LHGRACYNRRFNMSTLSDFVVVEAGNLPALLRDWREDAVTFLHHDMPKLVIIVVGALVLSRLLRVMVRRIAALQEKKLPSGVRAQKIRTMASVITSVGVFVIFFWAVLQALPLFGLNLGPLLASAGIAGLAIGFGAQTLVHDFINGFFILLENQYDIGDNVRIAGVKGTVEAMSLRLTLLRDEDGTVHFVPNSEIKIVSNTTRDWSQLTLRITVAYSEPSDRIVKLLEEVGEEVRHDPPYADDIVSDIQVPGIDRVGNGEAEYLMLIKTRPNKQYAVSRELRRRIKDSFHKQNVQTPGPGRVYVIDQNQPAS
jgi:small-conductance mechanosensitive channel